MGKKSRAKKNKTEQGSESGKPPTPRGSRLGAQLRRQFPAVFLAAVVLMIQQALPGREGLVITVVGFAVYIAFSFYSDRRITLQWGLTGWLISAVVLAAVGRVVFTLGPWMQIRVVTVMKAYDYTSAVSPKEAMKGTLVVVQAIIRNTGQATAISYGEMTVVTAEGHSLKANLITLPAILMNVAEGHPKGAVLPLSNLDSLVNKTMENAIETGGQRVGILGYQLADVNDPHSLQRPGTKFTVTFRDIHDNWYSVTHVWTATDPTVEQLTGSLAGQHVLQSFPPLPEGWSGTPDPIPAPTPAPTP